MKRICILFITICSVLAVVAAELPTYFSKWEKLPSKQLMDMGSRFAEFENKADSALVCFTIVAGRYRDNLPPEERHHTIIAQVGKWYVYFFRYFDYSKSYESLQRAYELAKMNGEQLLRIGRKAQHPGQRRQHRARDLQRRHHSHKKGNAIKHTVSRVIHS